MKGRKTGGRTVATPNKATSTLLHQVEQEAGAPLPVLLTRIGVKAMKEGDHQLAVNALSKAAAYTYPRIAAVDQDNGSPLTLQINTPVCECGKEHVTIVREIMPARYNGPDPT